MLRSAVMSRYSRRVLPVVALVLWAATALAQPAKVVPPDLDSFVQRVMQAFEVPGVSLAIVKDGQVVVAKGYGVRKLGEPAAVDGKTLFGIASNTKVFTATALGLLVEEGKLEWDAPVIDYLPGFPMYRPVRHPRTDHPRPAGAPERPRSRRRRPALVAADHLRSEGDRPAAALHQAGHQLPQRLRLRQRALPGGRRGHRDGERPVVGGLRLDAHPGEGRHDRAATSGTRPRRPAATSPRPTPRSTARSGPSSRSTATTPTRRAASTRAPTTWRSG